MNLQGIYVAAITPFKHEMIDFEALAHNYEIWNRMDVAGFVCLGSTSEFVSLTHEEKTQLISESRKLIPKEKMMLVGVGCHSVHETALLADHAAAVGADGLLVVTPFYYASELTTVFFRRYYLAVADRVALPLLIYNIPRFTGTNLSLELVSVLCRHERIVGTKDSTGDISRIHGLIHSENNVIVMTGDVNSLIASIMVGAHGAILAIANAFPQELCNIYTLSREGKYQEAMKVASPLINLTRSTVGKFGISGLKALMTALGYHAGVPRQPFSPVNTKQLSEIRRSLDNYTRAAGPG